MATALSIRHLIPAWRKPRVRRLALVGTAVSAALIAAGAWMWAPTFDRVVAAQVEPAPVSIAGVYLGTGADGHPVYQLPPVAVIGHRSSEWTRIEDFKAAHAGMNLVRWIVDRSDPMAAKATPSADRDADRSIQ
ncbi:MAG: hypothetical protein ABJC33_04025 [Betaproteobacteria bacterium]